MQSNNIIKPLLNNLLISLRMLCQSILAITRLTIYYSRPIPGPSNFQFTTTPGPGPDLHGMPPPPAGLHLAPHPTQPNSSSQQQQQQQPVYRLLTDTSIVQPPNGNASSSGTTPAKGTKRKRGRGGDDDEDAEDWTRQRKDNHVSGSLLHLPLSGCNDADLCHRKRLREEGEGILTKELMN